MKKIYYVTIFIIIILVSFLGITYSFEYGKNDEVKFELIGPDTLYLDIGDDYQEYGVKVTYNGMDVSKNVVIETDINTSILGKYKVRYTYGNEYIYRYVNVIDRTNPMINLIGGKEIYILLGGKYEEAGYIVEDNYDNSLGDKVVVIGTVDTSKEGDYTLEYIVNDSSGNVGKSLRKVYVRRAIINTSHGNGARVNSNLYNVSLYSNTIVSNKFTDTGVYYSGYVRVKNDDYRIILKKRNSRLEYTYNMTTTKNNYYSGNMNLTKVSNGVYDLYIVSNNEEKLMNKLDIYTRIVRSKIGNKLITFSYENDNVSVTVEDFEYKYDFVIDPGHGGY